MTYESSVRRKSQISLKKVSATKPSIPARYPSNTCLTEHPIDSSVFVNDVFNAIQHKSYLPGALPLPKLSAPPTARPQALPFDGIPMMSQGPPTGPSQNGSRKRPYNEQGDVDMQGANEFGARSFKQPRRGRGGRMQDPSSFRRGPPSGGFPGGGYQPPQLSAPQPGAPIFDPNNPMDALLKLQALGMPLPPMPDFAPHGPSALGGGQPARRRQRCRDYDIKGYCARGNTCMFEHGTDSIFVPPPMPLSQPQGNEGKPANPMPPDANCYLRRE